MKLWSGNHFTLIMYGFSVSTVNWIIENHYLSPGGKKGTDQPVQEQHVLLSLVSQNVWFFPFSLRLKAYTILRDVQKWSNEHCSIQLNRTGIEACFFLSCLSDLATVTKEVGTKNWFIGKIALLTLSFFQLLTEWWSGQMYWCSNIWLRTINIVKFQTVMYCSN